MVDIALDILLTILAIVGFLFNIYILVSVLLSKQVCRPSNLLVLHMSIVFSVLTLLFLSLSTPSLLQSATGNFVAGKHLCRINGLISLMLHPLSLWTVAGIHLDRFISIAYPLRYSSMITTRKAVFFLGISWTVVLIACLPTMLSLPPLVYKQPLGACAPEFDSNPFFPVGYVSIAILVPLSIVVGVNLRITNIAKHHQFRIANALFGMTLGSAAQHMQTEGAKAREQQRNALKRFEGTNAIGTLAQLVGTLCLFYLPTVVVCLYEAIVEDTASPVVVKATLMCLMFGPITNGFIFGIRNKTIQMTLINFARKEFYKNEVQQEIRLRSPGLGGSTRPSVSSIVGQITCQVPYLQRQVSEVSLIQGVGYRPAKEKPKMVRHVSDLTWRIATLDANLKYSKRSESAVSVSWADIDRRHSKHSLEVPADVMRCNIVTNMGCRTNSDSLSDDEEAGLAASLMENSYDCTRNENVFNPSRKRMSLTIGRFQGTNAAEPSPISAALVAVGKASFGPCSDVELCEDQSSSSESDQMQPLVNSAPRRNQKLLTYASKKSSMVTIPTSPTPTRNLSSAIRNMLLQGGVRRDKPKIIITRVPTVDQSSLEFLYPLPKTICDEDNNDVKFCLPPTIPSSPPSTGQTSMPTTPPEETKCHKPNGLVDVVIHVVPEIETSLPLAFPNYWPQHTFNGLSMSTPELTDNTPYLPVSRNHHVNGNTSLPDCPSPCNREIII